LTSTSPDRNSALEALAANLRQRHEDISTEISVFPSGAVFLDVRRGDRAWVLAYSPTHDQFGVDELGDHDGFTTSYMYTTNELEAAAQILIEFVAGRLPSGRRQDGREPK
jgi:hypothetical protein